MAPTPDNDNLFLDQPPQPVYDSIYLPTRASPLRKISLPPRHLTPVCSEVRPTAGERIMRCVMFGLLLLAICGTAAAQPPPGLPIARIQFVFPAGAKAGPTPQVHLFGIPIKPQPEVTVTGTDLEEPEKLLFLTPASRANISHPRCPNPIPRRRMRHLPRQTLGPIDSN